MLQPVGLFIDMARLGCSRDLLNYWMVWSNAQLTVFSAKIKLMWTGRFLSIK